MKSVATKVGSVDTLKWDSEHFGLLAGQISLSDELVESQISQFDFVQAKCNLDQPELVSKALKFGFQIAEIRVTFRLSLSQEPNDVQEVRKAKPEEVLSLRPLFKSIQFSTRYTNDPNFSKFRVKEMYEIWSEKSVRGKFDDECLVLWSNDVPVGFCTLKYLAEKKARIGLFGIAPQHTNKNYSQKLLNGVKVQAFKSGARECFVTTSGLNSLAMKTYENVGFRIFQMQYLFHIWPKK